ncbi:phage tail tape measure protein [Blautia wexlerae]|uniref:phage tail tape measure protein n=1 Tax=Blautia wexlerae TaxID=418240 RepID=UPI00321B3F60
MSDFKVKVTADLDTSQLEAKLMALQNRKITIQANANGNGLSNMNNSLQQIQNNANNVSASLKGIATTKLKVDALNFLKNQTENAVRSVTDLNKAMTLVNMTMSNMSGSSLYSLKQQSLSMAKALSTATKTVTDAVTIYANENESVSSMLNKAQPTVLLSAASGMSSSSSADAIQGILNQFNLSEDQAMHVADTVEKLSSEIALDFSKGCDTISQSIATSGSVVNEAGMSFEKYAALVSTTAEKTRVSGSQIGNAFKTIFSRISRSKDGLTTDAEMSDAEAALKSVGVSVRGADGDLRDISDTLDNLNEVWGTLNHSQRSYVAEMAAGVRQKNIFEAAMDSYNKALQLEQDALNSDGTAMKINEKRADSINGKMEKLSATMTQLYSDAMPEEAIEGMIDFATAVAKVVDNFGLFQGALSSLGVVGGAKIISTIASNWTGLLSAITSPLGIGTIAVGGAVAAISAYQKSVSEMVESAKQAGDEWESGQENLQGQIDKISELRTALDSGTLSEQEAASAKSELLSIQESLSESYGSQVAGIDLVNGSLTEQIALLDKVSAKEAERFQNENEKGIDKATKEIEKERHEYLGQFYDNGTQESEDIKKSIKDLQDKYGDDVFTTELEADGITMDLHFNADASTAREALNDFKTDISDIKKQYGESDVLNLLGDNASAGLSKANKVLDEYGDLYNQAQKAKLVADDDLYKAPSGKEQTAVKWLNDETKAVEAYNDALSEGNSDAIKQASTEFEAVDSAVQSLLKNSGMSKYADQFTEVKDQLNESAISANKFNEALSGNDSSKFGKQVKKSADALKELGLTDTDFKYAFETDGVQEGEDQINSLVDSAIQCGYISDTSSEQVSKLVSVLSSLGVISSTTGEAVGDATEEVASSVDTMSDALDSAKEKQTNLIDALGNSRSATGLTKDDINNVTSAFKDLDNFDPASIFEETATGVHLNTQALKEYNDELEQQTKNNFAEAITNKQQELNDAIAQNKSQDVIDGLQEEVQTLQLLSAQYDGATSSYNKFVTAASSANERDSFEDVAKSYESIGQLIEQGWTTDDSVTSYLDLLLGTDRIQDSQQAYEQLGQTIEGTGHSLKDYMTFDDDGNFTSQGAWSFVDDVANKLGDDFVKIGEDGEYAFDLTGDKINQVADAFNTTTDFVELMGKALADAGANVSFDSSDVKNYNEQMKQLQETANTTQEKLKEVQSATSGESGEGLLSGIDLNYDKASMSIDQLDSKIAELSGKREEISVSADTEEGQQAISALDNEIASLQSQKIMVSIGTQLEGGATVDELLAITDDAELAAKLQIDVSQVAEARQQLQTLKDTGNIEVPVTVKLDEGQFNSLIESLTGEAVEVPAEVETPEIPDVSGETVEYPSKVDTPDVPDVSGEEITYTATVDTPDLPDIQGGIAYYEPQVEGSADGETAEGTINYDKGTVESADGETSEGIINYDKGDVEKADGTVSTGTINYDLGTVAVPTGMVASGTINYALGTVATPGKAMGTFGQARAYAKGSLTDFPAYGDGRVSLPNDQKALVNEEYINGHSESIVRDGVWSLIPGGAHMENLKKGDIIFSASQTEDLLKRGATPGHARAYAQGSLSDLSPLSNAFGSGFSGTGRNPWAGKNTSSSSSGGSSSSQQSYNDNSGAVSNNTSATEDNTKSAKDSTEAFDWVKTKLDKFAKSVERISNQITDYISSTFKTVLLKRQVKAVEKQLKANEQGYTAYMDKANSVDISDDYKNKVINGTFSIEEIDTSSDSGKQLAKDIKSFQTYYNSAQDCKDTVQELNNKLLELYETIVNMPTEKAEKKIDRLKTKLESLNAVSDTVSLGGSAIAAMQNQIKVDNPGLGNAQKKLDKAETARNITKKTRAKASKTLKSATVDAESTGNTLIKESEKQTKSIGKKLKSAAKSSTNKATYNAIAQAIREGKAVNTKGLKGSALKYAKSYNSSLKQGNNIASKVKAGKTVKTSGMSNILKSTAQAYNADAKEKASAQKVYDNAKKADEKALNDLTKAQKNKEKLYAGSTKEQQILATTKGKKSYVYQNMLLTQETKNLKEQNKQRQTALKETRDSYMKAKSKYDTADADKTKSQNKLLKNKTVMSKLNKTQQKALKAGKTVSTKGITDPKVLKWIQDYNEKVKKSTDLSKKLRIEQEALDKATSEAAQSQAEYAQSIVENAKKKLENIANYYDSFTSQWENRNSMYEAYMDRMQTQGYNLSTKFYEAEIGQQQKIVDNLSQKYIAMKRNFAQAVQDGTIVEGTEEYYEMQNEIDQVAISLKEAQNKVVEFQASIRDLKWEQFDQLQEAIGRITSESDFLIDLMSHKDMYDKDGNMTEQGLATMGLHGVNYNTYMAQADKYKEEMLKISEELANDPNNQKLIDRKNELIDAQQQAILSAEDEKDSIKDLIQDGIDKQLDALDDLIDKYLDCLDSEKDLYEYRKKIGEQSEKITSLQKQLSSLQGDNSEENKAKLQKLKEDLKSAQDDMEETQYDKYISDQKKLLDELKQDYKKALDDRMDNVDVLISDAIASINSNSSNISQTLQTESKNVGYTLSGEMQTIWTSQSGVISQYGDDFSSKLTGVNSAIENVYNRQKDMIDAIDAMAGKLIAKADQMLQQPTKTEGVLEEVEQKPDKDNVAEGNPTPDPPKVSDDESIRDAVLVDPDEPKKKPNKNDNKKTGNNKAEVGDKVTFSSGRYYEASDGTGASGNMYLGKKVKITRINKGSKYPYAIDATDGTELGWVKLNQLKGYASGIMRVPNDQLAWTQEQGEEAIVRNDGSILTPLSRDVSVLNADMTKNLWDFMGNPGSFLSDYSDGEKFGVKNVDNSSSVDVGGVTIQCNMPNVQNANDLLHELTTNKDIEKAICAMTIGRAMSGSSLAKYKYKK